MAPLSLTLALLAITAATAAIKVVPLDMARDSFDDRYEGCSLEMAAALPFLSRFEFQRNPHLAWVWPKAAAEWEKRGSPVSPLASPDQAIAIMAYTMNDLYERFNDAVQAGGRSPRDYRDKFQFKALHFLLTRALASLRQAQDGRCRHVLRGAQDVLYVARRGQRVRFGRFASTSMNNETALAHGADTIFQVQTCYGVDVQEFSMYPDEEEVLIPPFEVFEVTDVTYDGRRSWVSLRSAGTFSKYNCEWL
ncbi:NAD(P)(+)--arginine ADP-ribosyltransferase 2-like [Prinia subflava]|uniref:NAD(P)(+)--arginine ADP-ribosyltransferase 2-like n=1 Tax=Prinia subflava TaxID=208062 RepID=UPI002FE28911